MKKLSIVILTSLISCSERKEVSEPAIDMDEITVVDTFLTIPDFSERFGSAGDGDPIWQYNEEIVPEGYIERIDDSQLEINGIAILPSESLIEELDLDRDKSVPPNISYTLRSTDEKISAYIQDKELISIILSRGISLELAKENLFDITFGKYKEKFPKSYSMRNFKTDVPDIMYYRENDSVKTLDFTALHTESGKLKFTWVNGRVERMHYDYLKW
jgi:hypothetical protein